MRRGPILLGVGVFLFVVGLMMPVVFTSDTTHCVEHDIDGDDVTCERTAERTSASGNPLRLPTIATGFVVGVVGVSIWGMDD